MLTWIMLLKFLADLELQREGKWKLVNPTKSTPRSPHPQPLFPIDAERVAARKGKGFKPAIEPSYLWCDWAAKADGITGDGWEKG